MPSLELFSKRQKRLSGEIPNIYIFNQLPNKIRVQITHIIQDAIGVDHYSYSKAQNAYQFLHNSLCREYGLFHLMKVRDSDRESVLNFFLTTAEFDKAIDVVELSFAYIDKVIGTDYGYRHCADTKITHTQAIEELNERFKENGIGFQYENGQIVKLDSTYIHSEIVKPTIALLWNKKFEGTNDEYMKAHEHYKHGRNKECLAECLKAFESTMKTICKEKKWPYAEKDTSSKLIQICLDNQLIPGFIQNQFTALRSLLENGGIATIRNNLGGHGQGQTVTFVDDQITRYALNLAGSNIIFLVEQTKSNKLFSHSEPDLNKLFFE